MRWWPTIPLPFPITQRSPIVMTGPLSTCSGDTPAESVAYGPMMHPSPSSIDDSPNSAAEGKADRAAVAEHARTAAARR